MEPISTFFKEERDFFYKRGLKKGIEEGIEKGIEKGISAITKNMIKQNVPLEQIKKFTNLTKKQIEAIIRHN